MQTDNYIVHLGAGWDNEMGYGDSFYIHLCRTQIMFSGCGFGDLTGRGCGNADGYGVELFGEKSGNGDALFSPNQWDNNGYGRGRELSFESTD